MLEESSTSEVHSEPEISASVAISTMLYAVSRGVPLDEIRARTGLTLADATRLDRRMPGQVIPALWRMISARHPERAVTLEMARSVPFSLFGPLAYGARVARTLREALQVFVRYQKILSEQLHVELVRFGEIELLWIRHPLDSLDRGAAAESGLALGFRFITEILGLEDVLRAVTFTHEPFGLHEEYEAFFGVPTYFEREYNGYLFAPGALDRPVRFREHHSLPDLGQHLRDASRKIARVDALEPIRQAIAHHAALEIFDPEVIARTLQMSRFALEQHARSQGSTLPQLIEDLRVAYARELLTDPRLTLDDVAFLLGYPSRRRFIAAYQRATGKNPR